MVLRYIIYKLFARHGRGHGIHSPFVYSFITDVLRNGRNIPEPSRIIEWHRLVRKDKEYMDPGSFGEGPRLGGKPGKKIGQIARISGIRFKYGKLLHRIVAVYKPEHITELGTGLGLSTAYLASGNPGSGTISIEGSELKAGFAFRQMKKLGLQNVEIINSDFDTVLENLEIFSSHLIFIDGNHNYEACLRYYRHFRQYASEGLILIFDDINWSRSMNRAWYEICGDNIPAVCIDLFFMGIVFFGKVSSRQYFKLKF